MPIIATAGHVDHGKSTLVEALTGRDPDRWQEEKERGLTIDLGFGWTNLAGRSVGFVDVPGHEKFIKNMLAGVGGLDVALLVVAADEGWMPQTEEHVAVLDLLDVEHAVVALTRIDLADEEVAQLAALEIEEKLEGTSLEGSPIVAVSAPSGRGIDELRQELSAALAAAGEPADIGRPRLWVDRSFSISGAGTVVTGTLLDGSLERGQQVELHPGPLPARVRGLQSHEAELESAAPGSRVAANLSGLDRHEVARGALLALPDQVRSTSRVLATLRNVRNAEEITDRGAFQLHAGSGAWPVTLRVVDDETVVLSAESPIPLAVGDRYILRETGRRAVVGGGRVLDPEPRLRSKAALVDAGQRMRAAHGGTADDIAGALLEVRGVAPVSILAVDSRGGVPNRSQVVGDIAISHARAEAALGQMRELVSEFHEENPLRPGIPKATLASTLDLPQPLIGALIGDDEHLIDDGATVRAADHGGQWRDADEAEWQQAAAALAAAGLAAPRAGQLGLRQELLHAALREQRIIRVADDLVYLPETIRQLEVRLAQLPDEFTVAEFRDAMEISRRQAVPLLEWLDANGHTSRRGDVRTVRRNRRQ